MFAQQEAMLMAMEELQLRLVVSGRQVAAEGVVTVELQAPSGVDLPLWSPGSHVDLALGNDLVRQYSLCGDPSDRTTWRIGVLRESEGRGGSAYVHDMVRVGDEITVQGPRNRFSLDDAPRYIFIAGGIGITPLLPMLCEATSAGADWELHYGGRSSASMAFCDELRGTYGERVRLHPQDEVGLIDLDSVLGSPRPDALVYCCGPAPLLDAVAERCSSWPPGSLRIERFSPTGVPVLDVDASTAFDVELARTGKTVTVGAEESVLEVLEEAGVAVDSSCREGFCGTCETKVLAGKVDHRDSLLSADEREANDTMFICVSRAGSGRLVLDL